MPRGIEERLLRLTRQAIFPAPSYAFLTQVPSETGYGPKRVADAVAMSLWPSRGLHLHGIECKATRQDWRRELLDPAKAERIARWCDFWWIVAPVGVVEDGELPDGWGLIVPTGGRGTIKARAIVRPSRQTDPEPISRGFLAALLKRAGETGTVQVEQRPVADPTTLRLLATIEAHAGVKITDENAAGLGVQLRQHQSCTPETGRVEKATDRLRRLRDQAAQAAALLERFVAEAEQ